MDNPVYRVYNYSFCPLYNKKLLKYKGFSKMFHVKHFFVPHVTCLFSGIIYVCRNLLHLHKNRSYWRKTSQMFLMKHGFDVIERPITPGNLAEIDIVAKRSLALY